MTGNGSRRRYVCSVAAVWDSDTVLSRWGRRRQGGWRRNGGRASGAGHRVAVRQCRRERRTGLEPGHRHHAGRGGECRDLPACEPGGESVGRVIKGAAEPYRVDVATVLPSPSRPRRIDGRCSGLHDSEGEHQGSGEDRDEQHADRPTASVILCQLCSSVVCPIWRLPPHDLRGRPVTYGGSPVPMSMWGVDRSARWGSTVWNTARSPVARVLASSGAGPGHARQWPGIVITGASSNTQDPWRHGCPGPPNPGGRRGRGPSIRGHARRP
jgi:hypothetical protein